MKKLITLFTMAACVAAPLALAQDMSLDDAIAAMPSYAFGQDRTSLSVVAEAMRDAANEGSEAVEALEARLVAVLNGERTAEAARFISKQLGVFGGKASVEALTPLLHDPELAESALDALERNPSDFARIALRQTVESASGVVRIGAIQAIAARGDMGLNELLVSIANDAPAPERLAAVDALGKVGGAVELEPLATLAGGSDAGLAGAANQARLQIAERLAAGSDASQAEAVYEALAGAENPAYLRAAALAGKIALHPDQAESLITAAFEDDDPSMQRLAMGFLREVEGDALPGTFAEKLGDFPAGTQILVLATLRDRGTSVSAVTFKKLLNADNEAVQLAAIDAMPACGGDAVVPLLLDTAVNQSRDVKRAARAALVALQGDSVNASLLERVACDQPVVADEALRALSGRAAVDAVPKVLGLLEGQCTDLEERAWSTLEDLAQPGDVAAMVTLLNKLQVEDARDNAERAIATAARRGADRAHWADAVLAGAEDPSSEALAHSLLRVLGSIANEPALGVLRAAARQGDPATQGVALAALGGWDSAAPVEDLLAIAESSEGAVRTQALGSALDLLRKYGAALVSGQAELLQKAAALVSTESEKRVLLAGLSTLSDPAAFALIDPYAGDPAFTAEVEQARLAVCRALAGAYPDQVRAVLTRLQAETANDAVREQAGQILASLDAMGPYVTAWQVAGPYSEPGKIGAELFGIAYPPEDANAEVVWNAMPMGLDPGMPYAVALGKLFGDCGCTAYVRTYLHVDAACAAVLAIGSNDGVRVWLNGQLVHETNDGRPLTPDQDAVPVDLAAGWNTVMLKVINHGGDWGATLRVNDADGNPLGGMKTSVKPE